MLNALDKLKGWLLDESDDARRELRTGEPEVIVHYWDGSVPAGRCLRDINQYGAYIYTPERWYRGTVVRLVLQGYRTTIQEDGTTIPTDSTCVNARVVRHGADGVAVEFVFLDEETRAAFQTFLKTIPAQPARTPSGKAVPRQIGQALIEFVLIVPMALLLAVNAINFAGFIFAWITVANAARAGAQYMTLSSASPGAPTLATQTQIKALITSDVASLRNSSSVVVAICTNSTSSSNGCTTLTDPEAPSYTLVTVDVTYTYNPYIPMFSFPGLGLRATLPSSTVHRKAVMRMVQ